MGLKLGPALKIRSQVSQLVENTLSKKNISLHTHTKQAFDQPTGRSLPLSLECSLLKKPTSTSPGIPAGRLQDWTWTRIFWGLPAAAGGSLKVAPPWVRPWNDCTAPAWSLMAPTKMLLDSWLKNSKIINMCYFQKKTYYKDQWDREPRSKSSRTGPDDIWQRSQDRSMGKGQLFQQMVLEQLDVHMLKNDVGSRPNPYIKINSIWVKDVNKWKTKKHGRTLKWSKPNTKRQIL